jgi:hypothetical protein
VLGPAEKAPERVRQEIVRSPRLRGVIDDLVDDRTTRHTLEVRAHDMLRELQATPDRTTVFKQRSAVDLDTWQPHIRIESSSAPARGWPPGMTQRGAATMSQPGASAPRLGAILANRL